MSRSDTEADRERMLGRLRLDIRRSCTDSAPAGARRHSRAADTAAAVDRVVGCS